MFDSSFLPPVIIILIVAAFTWGTALIKESKNKSYVKGYYENKRITVALTPDILGYLYLSAMNEINMNAISNVGVIVPGIQEYLAGDEEAFKSCAQNKGRPVTFKKEDIIDAYKKLDPYEIELIDKIHSYFNDKERKTKNEISRKYFGHNISTAENYVPKAIPGMLVGDAFVVRYISKSGEKISDSELERRSKSNKEPLEGRGILDVFAKSVEATGKYYTSAPAEKMKYELESMLEDGSIDKNTFDAEIKELDILSSYDTVDMFGEEYINMKFR